METQTGFSFTLPRGYLDPEGNLHRDGVMRLATALDEIEAVSDLRVQQNTAYLPVILLSRVLTHLGSLPAVTPPVLEQLFAGDLAYLEDLYLRLNASPQGMIETICPHCGTPFQAKAVL
jgi:hypothetical protein